MTARALAVRILQEYERGDDLIDHLIAKNFEHSGLSHTDKRLTNELVNGTLRWRIKIDWILNRLYHGNVKKIPVKIVVILELAVYQLLLLDKIPDYAAVHEAVKLAKNACGLYWGNLVNAILRTYIRERDSLEEVISGLPEKLSLSINCSHPQWIIDRWIDRYGQADTIKLCAYNNTNPVASIRINTLKIDKDRLLKILNSEGYQCEPGKYLDEFIRLDKFPDLRQDPNFLNGFFTIQDESAGLATHLLDPQPSDLILDVCAAPGGKTTHIAEIAPSSRIYAIDRYFKRLLLIRENSVRLGLANISLICADATNFAGGGFDKILVDAPCSGFGVLSRRSDIRFKRESTQINELTELQHRLLENAAQLLNTGGSLVYSTCTIEPDENELIVERFLRTHPEFAILEPNNEKIPEELIVDHKYIQSLPYQHNIDGAFSVKLQKVT